MSLPQEPTSNNLAHWVQRLTSRDMPIFAQTAKKIAVVSSMNQSTTAVLANAILQDALMTSKVLKPENNRIRAEQDLLGFSFEQQYFQ